MGVKMSNTILVIEDNEQNMYLVTFILEKHGYKVLQAQTGKDGLVLAQANPIDLILLDIQLPELDGYAIAQMLRKVEKLKDIPIIAVTSYAMTGDKEKALASGCSGYIEKPINPDTFMKEVQQFL
jgi:two-component system, cell cycle response regulator DivK